MNDILRALQGRALGPVLALFLMAVVSLAGLQVPTADARLAEEAGRCLITDQWLLQWAPGLLSGHGSPYFLFRPTAGPLLGGALVALGLAPPVAARIVSLLGLGLLAWLGFRLGRELWSTCAGTALATTLVLAGPAAGLRLDLATILLLTALLLVLLGSLRLPAPGASIQVVAGLLLAYLSAASAALLPVAVTLLVAWQLVPPEGRNNFLAGVGATVPLTAFHWLPALIERRGLRPELPLPPPPPLSLPFLALLLCVAAAAALRARNRGTATVPHRGFWIAGLALQVLVGAWMGLGLPGPEPALTSLIVLAVALAVAGLVAAMPRRSGAWLSGGVAVCLVGLALLGGPARGEPALRPPIPIAVQSLPPAGPGRFTAQPECDLNQVRSGSDLHFVDTVCRGESILDVRLFYFPGWTVTVDNVEVEFQVHPVTGTIRIPVSQGTHRVSLEFEETGPRVVGRALTLIAAVALLTLWILRSSHRVGVTPGTVPGTAPRDAPGASGERSKDDGAPSPG